MAKSVMEQLLKDGKVRRGMLGINIQNITDDMVQALDLKDRAGVLVSGVKPGSAAEKAGLKPRDVIVAINGEKIEDSNVLRNKVAGSLPGSTITLTVLRDGKETDLSATLDEFDTKAANTQQQNDQNGPNSGGQGGKLGVELQPVTPQIAKQLGLDNTQGVVVTQVDPTGPAAESNIMRGDVILEINKKAVNSVEDVRSAIEGSGGKPIVLLIARQGQTFFVTVRLDQ
ncbi:MAG: PDZ domain-containing protein [Pyrinomonadaceae bacterium]|nr:PDZ domain-containing protein [Pyrinomonadaceae bacterium]